MTMSPARKTISAVVDPVKGLQRANAEPRDNRSVLPQHPLVSAVSAPVPRPPTAMTVIFVL